MFDGDGIAVGGGPDGGGPDGGVPALVGPLAGGSGAGPQIENVTGTSIESDGDESLVQTLHSVDLLPPGNSQFNVSIPAENPGRLRVQFVDDTANGRLALHATGPTGVLLSSSVSGSGVPAAIDLHLSPGDYLLSVDNDSASAIEVEFSFTSATSPLQLDPATGRPFPVGIAVDAEPTKIIKSNLFLGTAAGRGLLNEYSALIVDPQTEHSKVLVFTALDDGSLASITTIDLGAANGPVLDALSFDVDQTGGDELALLFADSVLLFSIDSPLAPFQEVTNPTNGSLRDFSIGDINADGLLDLAVGSEDQVALIWDFMGAGQVELLIDSIGYTGDDTGVDALVIDQNMLLVSAAIEITDPPIVGTDGAPYANQLLRYDWANGHFPVAPMVYSTGVADRPYLEPARYGELGVYNLVENSPQRYAVGLTGVVKLSPAGLEPLYSYGSGGEIADMDGDGALDHVTPALSVAIARLDEQMQFRAFAHVYSAAPLRGAPVSMELDELNHDGRTDAIVGLRNFVTGQYQIVPYLASVPGSFQFEQSANRLDSPDYLASGDFNRDGFNDVLGLGGGGQISLQYGVGNGSFVTETNLDGVPGLFGFKSNIIRQDFNNDGRLDIAVLQEMLTPLGVAPQAVLAVRLGLGDGRFLASEIRYVMYEEHLTARQRHSLVADDFNGDGNVDFAVLTTDTDRNLYVDVFDGSDMLDPSSEPRRPVSSFSTGLGVVRSDGGRYRMVSGDFDHVVSDGRDLVVITEREGRSLETLVLANQGNFNFELLPTDNTVVNATITDLESYDINGDGLSDLILVTPRELVIWEARGNNEFLAHEPLISLLGNNVTPLDDVVIADLDQDLTDPNSVISPPELIISDRESQRLRIFTADGSSFDFTERSLTDEYLLPANSSFNLAVVDQFDQIGGRDVLLVDERLGEILLYQSGNELLVTEEVRESRVLALDIDGDNWDDYVTLDESGRVQLRLASQANVADSGASEFTFVTPTTLDRYSRDIVVRQSNGQPEIVMVSTTPGQPTRILSSRWDAVEQQAVTTTLATYANTQSIGVGELLPGGGEEIILVERGEITSLRIINDFGLVHESLLDLPGNAAQISVLDGRLLITDANSSLLSVYDANGELLERFRLDFSAISDGMESGGRTLSSLSGSRQFAFGDFNRDGRLDLAALSAGADSVSIIYGAAAGFGLPAQRINLAHPGIAIESADINKDGADDLVILQDDEHRYYVVPPMPSEAAYVILRRDLTLQRGTATIDYLSQLADTQDQFFLETFQFENRDVDSPYRQRVEGEGVWSFDPDSGQLEFMAEPGLATAPSVKQEEVLVVFGDQQGNLDPQTRGASLATLISPAELTLNDVDQNGFVDLVMTNQFGDLVIYRNVGDPGVPFELATTQIEVDNQISLDLVNFDGITTAVTAKIGDTDRLRIHQWMPADQQETLVPTKTYEEQTPANARLQTFLVGGEPAEAPYLVYLNEAGNSIVMRRGFQLADGSLTFDSILVYAAGTQPTDFAVQDINGDGYSDIVIANAGSNDLTVLLGAQQGDTINFNTVAQRLTLDNIALASGEAFIGDLRPQAVSFSNTSNAADLLVAFEDAVGNSGFATLANIGNGLFSDQTGGITVGPATDGTIINAAFIGNQGVALLSSGNVIRFDPGVPNANPLVGAFTDATFIKPLVFENQLLIGVARADSVQFVNATQANQIAATINFSDAQDFVFEEARNLLFLANSNEFVTVRELAFVISTASPLGDLGGILAFSSNHSDSTIAGTANIAVPRESSSGTILVSIESGGDEQGLTSPPTLRSMLESLAIDVRRFVDAAVEKLADWTDQFSELRPLFEVESSTESADLVQAGWRAIRHSLLVGFSADLVTQTRAAEALLQYLADSTKQLDGSWKIEAWEMALQQLLDTPVDELRATILAELNNAPAQLNADSTFKLGDQQDSPPASTEPRLTPLIQAVEQAQRDRQSSDRRQP